MKTLDFKNTEGAEIYVYLREWEGVGRPDYNLLDTVSIIEAEALVNKLQGCIEHAKRNKINAANNRIEQLRKEIEERQSELSSLEKQNSFDMQQADTYFGGGGPSLSG